MTFRAGIVLLAAALSAACGAQSGSGSDPAAASESECRNNDDCDADDRYCAKPPGECGGSGACETRPQFCVDLWSPVCACNGKTYSNDCYAALEGQNVDYEGECGKADAEPES